MSVEHIGKGYVKICVSEEELENSIAGLSQLKPILQTQAMKGNGRNTKQGSKLYSCTGYDCREPYRRAYEYALSRIRERQET